MKVEKKGTGLFYRLLWIAGMALFYLLLMSASRLGLIYYAAGSGQGINSYWASMWMGLHYDLREVGILALFLLLFSSIPYFSPFTHARSRNYWLFFLGIINVGAVLFYIIDFIHFDYLYQRFNAATLNLLEDTQTSFTMLWQTYPLIRLTILVIGLSWGMLWLQNRFLSYCMKQNASGSRKAHPMFFVFFVLLCSIGIYGKLGQYPLRWSDAFSLGNERSAQLALNPFQSFFSSLDYRHINYDLNSTQATYKQMADYLGVDCKDAAVLNYNRTIKAANTSLPAPNIVLVICESFSAYKSSMWGNHLNPTPFFDTLCSQGIFFDHCFTPHFGTARGVWSTLTGLPDVLLENTASRNPLLVDQHCLINDFTDYHKYYFIGGSASWANIKGLLLNNIDSLKLYEGNDFKDVPKLDVWGISDKNLFLQANQILAREKKPFFAVIQTADNHRPYTIPKEDRAEFTDVTLPDDSLHKYGYQRNNELNAFRFTDFCFKKFIEAARKEKYFANTIFVFVGDHGIRGNAGTMFPNAWTNNGLTSFHVPLLFYAPAFLNAARYPQNCSQLDVLPTLAGLAHIGYINTGLGQDLLKADRPAANTAFIIDHDARSIGLVSGNYFFSRNLSSGTKSLVSIINNEPIVQNAYTDSLEKALNSLNDAFYETSKYLLFHNKKPAKAKP